VKIGFDVSQTGRWKAGCGYFADSLITELVEHTDTEFILYPTFGDGVWDPDWCTSTAFPNNKPNVDRGLAHSTFEELRAFWQNTPGDLETRLGSPDLIHANNFFAPSQLKHARLVYTLYDLGFIKHPEWTTEANRITCFNGVFNASLYADHIISISEYSRQHFLSTFPHYPADRVSVVYPASRFKGPANLARPVKLSCLEPDRFWLCVGTLEPRKNHVRLLEAYARLRSEFEGCYPLVLAGGDGWLMDKFEDRLVEFGLTPTDVIRLGYVDDSELAWLYANCFAFCYLSNFEGFGLPVAEAMSMGAAVIASNTTSLPEVVGRAGLLVDPQDVQAITAAMRRLLMQPAERESLRALGMEQAATFSWKHAAARVLEIYGCVLADHKPTFEIKALAAQQPV
jgi:glycosyltransferase involved in cell wall biosynthesis